VMAEMLVAESEVIASLMSLPSVSKVVFHEPNRFVVEYDAEQIGLDLVIMKHLSEKGWPYRQLVNGRTLEDQLYFG